MKLVIFMVVASIALLGCSSQKKLNSSKPCINSDEIVNASVQTGFSKDEYQNAILYEGYNICAK